MGRRLENLVPFDAGVFYLADLEKGTVRAGHACEIRTFSWPNNALRTKADWLGRRK